MVLILVVAAVYFGVTLLLALLWLWGDRRELRYGTIMNGVHWSGAFFFSLLWPTIPFYLVREHLKRREQERVFGRLRAVAVRLHRQVNGPLGAVEVQWVPDEVVETPEGYTVTMIDGRGDLIERIYLDKSERVVRREKVQ